MKFLIFVITFYATNVLALGFESEDIKKGQFMTCSGQPVLEKDIVFLKDFFSDIYSGKKTATSRRGKRCYKVGQVVDFKDTEGKLHGQGKITRLRLIDFQSIDRDLASAENTSIQGLQNGLVKIYGDGIKKSPITAIYFDFIPGTKKN